MDEKEDNPVVTIAGGILLAVAAIAALWLFLAIALSSGASESKPPKTPTDWRELGKFWATFAVIMLVAIVLAHLGRLLRG